MLDKFQSYDAVKEQIETGYQYFLLRYKGNNVGYSGIQIRENMLFLSKIYLLEDYRGLKISSAVIAYYETICREKRLSGIWLTCNKHNKSSIAAYKHMGFSITDTKVADIGSGYIMDDYILTKETGVPAKE